MKSAKYQLLSCFVLVMIPSLGGADAIGGEAITRLALFMVDGAAKKSSSFPASGELTGEEICTGTAVGTNAVLTAAHCVQHGKAATIKLNNKVVHLTCYRHPEFMQSGNCDNPSDAACSADVALCKASDKIDLGASKYEVIQTDASKLVKDMEIVMVGYGCTGDGKTDHGTLYMGQAKVTRLSSENPKSAIESLLFTTGGAVTCPGDSGAGNFDVENASKRFIIAVSKQRMQTLDGKLDKSHSAMVQITDKRIGSFLRKWGEENKANICGVHKDASGCR
jgi:V8-like Glu-specific endopeptidase